MWWYGNIHYVQFQINYMLKRAVYISVSTSLQLFKLVVVKSATPTAPIIKSHQSFLQQDLYLPVTWAEYNKDLTEIVNTV